MRLYLNKMVDFSNHALQRGRIVADYGLFSAGQSKTAQCLTLAAGVTNPAPFERNF
jgi:hypothetical protein